MLVLIVTTWFERGASYVSRQFRESLESQGIPVLVYARGGERYSRGIKKWDNGRIIWNRDLLFEARKTPVNFKQILKVCECQGVTHIIWNEQQDLSIITRVRNKLPNVRHVSYIDYYKKNNTQDFAVFDGLICNTKRHYSVFHEFAGSVYIPWGVDQDILEMNFSSEPEFDLVLSVGMNPHRKGLDLFLLGLEQISDRRDTTSIVIYTQVALDIDVHNFAKKGFDITVRLGDFDRKDIYRSGSIYVYLSRLDGIGLSLPEALVSGMLALYTDHPPMNEFVQGEHHIGVAPSGFSSRRDNYYWDECNLDSLDVARGMERMLMQRSEWLGFRLAARDVARSSLNWNNNSLGLNTYLDKLALREKYPLLAPQESQSMRQILSLQKQKLKRWRT